MCFACGVAGPVHPEDAYQDAAHGAGRIVPVQSLLQDVHTESSSEASSAHSQSRQTVQVSAV